MENNNSRKVQNKYGVKEETLITIESNDCWSCGKITKTTKHHAIPQSMKPKKNTIIPVCQICHDKINARDHRGMLGFAYKIMRQAKSLVQAVKESK